ncbi:MAG: diguanylate cyclase [Oscillatoriales cyanobacterium SM2_1_8]|nr:diguanylate cyclase [Oscillatoriales cyanobacterium SM2_1_8]
MATPNPASILVVDDTPANLQLLTRLLTRNHYAVRSVTSGRIALAVIRANPPNLVLLDVNMPDLDGFAVCSQLKQDPHTQKIPVIFISAYDDIHSKLQGFAVGGNDYISKPFQVQEVLVRVRNQLIIAELQHQLARQNMLLQSQNEQLLREVAERQETERQLRQAVQELSRLVNLDGLTVVANRRAFDTYVCQQWQDLAQSNAPLALILGDVDFFKAYNDTYGHHAGDRCLQEIAQSLEKVGRDGIGDRDFLVARYGGEEFVLVWPRATGVQAQTLAETCRQAVVDLAIPHETSEVAPMVTASFGVASIVPRGNDPSILFAMADQALYEAKNRGRNRVYAIG